MASRVLMAGAGVLEHPLGFLASCSPAADVDLSSGAAFGCSWRSLSEGLNMKLFNVCYAAHRLINSATALRDSPACRVQAIREVRVSLGKPQSQIACYNAPTNSLEAKLRVECAAQAAILAGHVSLGEIGRAPFTENVSY